MRRDYLLSPIIRSEKAKLFITPCHKKTETDGSLFDIEIIPFYQEELLLPYINVTNLSFASTDFQR